MEWTRLGTTHYWSGLDDCDHSPTHLFIALVDGELTLQIKERRVRVSVAILAPETAAALAAILQRYADTGQIAPDGGDR